MFARIYQPSKTAMSSGSAKTHDWILEYEPASGKEIDPLMGWTSSSDTTQQVKIKFPSKEAAIKYAKEKELNFIVQEPHKRKPNIRPLGYGENFASSRKTPWTH